jgi:lipid II:glycine glycyltransferase (peptidoglycan interpeptide bridge formation enzyme)
MDELRRNMDQKWRNCLNKAEKNGLEVVAGDGDDLFAEFISLYREMLTRKNFHEPNNILEFRTAQSDLPREYKMEVFICRSPEGSAGGVILGVGGDTALYLFGATNRTGMANKAAYLLQWKALGWMKDRGYRYYNLNGINALTNPGTYHFKIGLAGRTGREMAYLGRFDCYPRWANKKLVEAASLGFAGAQRIRRCLQRGLNRG